MPSTEGTEGVTCEKKCTGETNTLRSRRLSAHQLLVVKKTHIHILVVKANVAVIFIVDNVCSACNQVRDSERERERERERCDRKKILVNIKVDDDNYAEEEGEGEKKNKQQTAVVLIGNRC